MSGWKEIAQRWGRGKQCGEGEISPLFLTKPSLEACTIKLSHGFFQIEAPRGKEGGEAEDEGRKMIVV